MITFIDADSLLFKVASTSDTKYDMRNAWKRHIKNIKNVTWNDQAIVGVKGSNRNFRYDLYPDYKGKRPVLANELKEKLNYLHEFAVDQGAVTAREGWETDDEVAEWVREAVRDGVDYTIAHIDKDLDMLIGAHYNYNKDTHYNIDIGEAQYNFYHQMLTGDRSDNIPGVSGIGKVKATRILDSNPKYWYRRVRSQYPNRKTMELNARLLFMGDPENFTYDLESLYVMQQEGQPVLHWYDKQDGEGSGELLRDQRDGESVDRSTESNHR